MIRRTGIVLAGGLGAAALYLLLIDTTSLPELLVIPAVVLLSGAGFALVGDEGMADARIAPGWLRNGWRALARVPVDIGYVVAELPGQLLAPRARRGTLRAVPFATTGDGGQSGRMGLAEALGSLAPNTIVIGVDSERGLLLVHQLRRHGGEDEIDVLRLG